MLGDYNASVVCDKLTSRDPHRSGQSLPGQVRQPSPSVLRGQRADTQSNMLRLLALVAAASAYPHHFYNPYYGLPLVPGPYHPIAPLPQQAPLARAGYQETYLQDEQTARYLINFEAFQRVQGVFKTDGAMKTVTGSASFYQNPFTGTNSKYRIDLTGITAGKAYWLALTDDCSTVTTIKELKKGTAPGLQLFNTFKLYGTIDDYNIDGAGSNSKLTDMFLVVRETDMSGTIIGCTAAKLQ